MPEDGASKRRRGWVLAAALLAAAAVRVAFLAWQGVPVFDPWRHLKLIENLRAGLGFTLFEGQPYIWYAEAWYRLCAWAPPSIGPQWIAGFFSWLSVPALWLWLERATEDEEGREPALRAAALAAGFGPLVVFTCHYGSEAISLFLLLAALSLAATVPRALASAVSGLMFGTALAARINLAFDVFLFLPLLRGRGRAGYFAGGAVLPLAAAWWRNRGAIAAYPYLFTWDGLATRTSDFGPFSTLVLQAHPAIREGLERLHAQIVPRPEWISTPSGTAWGPLLFMVGGAACLLASRKWHLIAAGLTTFAYFLLLDGSGSSNFFRVWLGIFPVLLAAIAVVAARLGRLWRRAGPAAGWIVIAATLATGAAYLRPVRMYPIEMLTPPPHLLTEGAYLVNSSFYHPESLMWRFPDKRFVGMPLDPAQFQDFRARYPEYRCVLWHDFSVQDGLLAYLLGPGGYGTAGVAANDYGRRYAVLCPGAGAGATEPSGRSERPPPASGGGGGSSTR